MHVAVIDVGTNTVLLLVARVDNDGNITTLVYEQRVPRLGRGVDASRRLHADSMNNVIQVLTEYRSMIQGFPVEKTIVAGTSAVRDASNFGEFIDMVKKQTGFDLEVVSGKDEALWTYRGAVSGIPQLMNATVIDIGGGSTEISTGDRTTLKHTVSFDIGSVRLTERFFRHDPPTEEEVRQATEFVRATVTDSGSFDHAGSKLVGVAGTATSLALLDQGLKTFTRSAVTNYRLTRERANAIFGMLQRTSSREIENFSSVMVGRSDVIVAGALILCELMTFLGFEEMIVSERGVRYGLAIREWERATQRNGNRSSTSSLFR